MEKDDESSSDSGSWTVLDNEIVEDFTKIDNSKTDDEEEDPFDFNSSLYQQTLLDVLYTIKAEEEPIAEEDSDDDTDGISVISDESDENSLSREKSHDWERENKDILKSFQKNPEPIELDVYAKLAILLGAVYVIVSMCVTLYVTRYYKKPYLCSLQKQEKYICSQQMVWTEHQVNPIKISLNNVYPRNSCDHDPRGEIFGPAISRRAFNESYKQDEHQIVEIIDCFPAIQFQKVIDLAVRLRDDFMESKVHFDKDDAEYKHFWKTQIYNTVSSINNNLGQFEDLLLINRRNYTVIKNSASCSTLSTELHKSANNFLKFQKNIQSFLSKDQTHYMSLMGETAIDDKRKIEKMSSIYALGDEYSRELANKISDFLSNELKVQVAETDEVDDETDEIETDQEINVEVDEEEIDDEVANVEEIDDEVVDVEEVDDEEVNEYINKTNNNQNNTIELLHELFKIGINFFDRNDFQKYPISKNILLKALLSSTIVKHLGHGNLEYDLLNHEDIFPTIEVILEKLKIISGTSSDINLVLNKHLLVNFNHTFPYTLTDAILLNKNEIQTYTKNHDFYNPESIHKPRTTFVTERFSLISEKTNLMTDIITATEEIIVFNQITALLDIISESMLVKLFLYRHKYDDIDWSFVLMDNDDTYADDLDFLKYLQRLEYSLSSSILRDRKVLDSINGVVTIVEIFYDKYEPIEYLMVKSRNHWHFVQNDLSLWRILNKYNYHKALKTLDKLKNKEPFSHIINELKNYLSMCEIENMFDEEMDISITGRALIYRRQMNHLYELLEEGMNEINHVHHYKKPLWSSNQDLYLEYTDKNYPSVTDMIKSNSEIDLINFRDRLNELNEEELTELNKENEEHDTKLHNIGQITNDKNLGINSKKAFEFNKSKISNNINIEKKQSATMDKTPKKRQKLVNKTIKDREDYDKRTNNKNGSTMNKMTKNRQKKRDRKEDMERPQLQNSNKFRKTEKITNAKEHTNNKKKSHSKKKKKQQYLKKSRR